MKMIKATILARGGPERIEIQTSLYDGGRGRRWIWRDEDGDCGVSGRTKAEAIRAARAAWAGADFKLKK